MDNFIGMTYETANRIIICNILKPLQPSLLEFYELFMTHSRPVIFINKYNIYWFIIYKY